MEVVLGRLVSLVDSFCYDFRVGDFERDRCGCGEVVIELGSI